MGKGKGGGRHYSPNDMRSMAMNPNSSACKAAVDNRAMQLNPEAPVYSSSRNVSEGGGSTMQVLREGDEEAKRDAQTPRSKSPSSDAEHSHEP